MKPTEKVQAGGYAGAAGLILVYVLEQAGITLPPAVAAAAALLLAGLGAWIKTEGAGWFKRGKHAGAG